MLWNASEISAALLILGVLLLAIETGYRLGRKGHAKAEEADRTHISALQGPLLGLMGFLIAFTLAMSVGRFDTRKALAIQESNAISTTYLRAGLLPEAQRQPIEQLLHAYVDAWRLARDADAPAGDLDAAIMATVDLQQRLWTAAGVLAEQGVHTTAAGLFVHALNDMIDLHEKRLRALENHVPEVMFWLVVTIAVVALSFVGYRSGLDDRRRFRSTAAVALVVTLVLTVILDLDRPRHGFIKIDRPGKALLMRPVDPATPAAVTGK